MLLKNKFRLIFIFIINILNYTDTQTYKLKTSILK
jgi:hypothetical protein